LLNTYVSRAASSFHKVMEHFLAISAIPRGSGNEEAVSAYIENFAKDRGLFCIRDSRNNVYCRRPASPGYEEVPPVVLQGHMDMVCEANSSTVHNFITDPIEEDYLPFLEKYSRYVRRWSYAPERDDGTFCDALIRFGVLPSAGHTDALGLDLRRAAEHGCRLTTHLFSCTSTITREGGYRRTGVLEETLLNDDITAEIITDGCHLPHDLIKLTYKIKGRERVALCSDALSAAGQDITSGELNGVPFIVEDGVCRLTDRTAFCGSIATGDRLVRTCVAAGISLTDSVYMAAATPADLLGLPKGRIEVGKDADLIVFDENINVKAVYLGE